MSECTLEYGSRWCVAHQAWCVKGTRCTKGLAEDRKAMLTPEGIQERVTWNGRATVSIKARHGTHVVRLENPRAVRIELRRALLDAQVTGGPARIINVK